VANVKFGVELDGEACLGSGTCGHYAPDAFELDDARKSTLRQLREDELDATRNAVEACPSGALSLIED
jgi:ferredoxin